MQRFSVYAIGQTVVIEGFVTDSDGNPTAPVDPKILLLPPGGTETELAVSVDVPAGRFFHELYLDGAAGPYTYRLLTSTDAEERDFHVVPSKFANPLGAP